MKLELKRKEVRRSIYLYTYNFNEADLQYLNDYLKRIYGSNTEPCPQVTMEDVKNVYNNDWYDKDHLLKNYNWGQRNQNYFLAYAVQDYLNDLVWESDMYDEVDSDTDYVEDWVEDGDEEQDDEDYDGSEDYRYDTNDR